MGNRAPHCFSAVLSTGLLLCAACAGGGGASAREPTGYATASKRQPETEAPNAPIGAAEEQGSPEASAKLHGRWQPDVLAWAPAEHLIGAGSDAIVVVDAGRNRIVTRHEVAVSNPNAIAASPDGKRVVVSDVSEKGFLLWDANARSAVRLNGHGERVVAVAMSPDGQRAASVAWNGTSLLWDLAAKKQIGKVEISNGAGGAELSAVAFSGSGRRIALGTIGGNVCIWDPGDGSWKIIARHNSEPDIKPSKILPAVKGLAFASGGKFVVSGGQDQYVLLTDPNRSLEGSSAGPYEYIGVQALAVSPEGDLLAIAHADGVDVVSCRLVREKQVAKLELSMKAHIDIRGGAQSLAFSPEGQRLAASIIGEGVTIWEVTTGESFALDPK